MRRDLTFAEKQLWHVLRRIDGFHFRRQVPFGAYVVDFACHPARLIVEVDGGIHDFDVVAARDAERARWLEGRGYRVVRLRNADVIADPGAAVQRILAGVSAGTPTPDPSPQGGGGRKPRRSRRPQPERPR
jgi:very-short-patch-repair endonuclease